MNNTKKNKINHVANKTQNTQAQTNLKQSVHSPKNKMNTTKK